MRIACIIIIFSITFSNGCIHFQRTSLYHADIGMQHGNLVGLNAPKIYDGRFCGEIWFTQNTKCIHVNRYPENGREQISISWNKPGGGCDWVGMGIGWNGWSGKDFSQCIDTAALSFSIKSNKGVMKNLPWAVGFEDFSGGQAWTGFNTSMIEGGRIDENWTHVIVPLYAFPFVNRSVDVANIKQIIFQFETSGEVLMDHIEIVPYHIPKTRTFHLTTEHKCLLGNNALSLRYDSDSLYINAQISDSTPFQQNKTGRDIWNGDALEIAFATDASIAHNRPFLYESDRHIGIALSQSPEVWDWSRNKKINSKTSITAHSGLVNLSLAISWKELDAQPWKGGDYNFEWAIDEAGIGKNREHQSRWNSSLQEGFHENPSLWGIMKIENIQIEIK